jgi:hypothetical protein
MGGIQGRAIAAQPPPFRRSLARRAAAKWTCSIEARDQLAEHVGPREATCTPSALDVYHRTLAVCRLGAEEILNKIGQSPAVPLALRSGSPLA